MKELTVFYLTGCPYCMNARRAVAKLQSENPAYAAVEVEWKDESLISQFPDWCDYYHVPSVYLGRRKLYEAQPGDSADTILAHMRSAFEAALKAEA